MPATATRTYRSFSWVGRGQADIMNVLHAFWPSAFMLFAAAQGREGWLISPNPVQVKVLAWERVTDGCLNFPPHPAASHHFIRLLKDQPPEKLYDHGLPKEPGEHDEGVVSFHLSSEDHDGQPCVRLIPIWT